MLQARTIAGGAIPADDFALLKAEILAGLVAAVAEAEIDSSRRTFRRRGPATPGGCPGSPPVRSCVRYRRDHVPRPFLNWRAPVSVLVFYKSTPEGAEAVRAGARQAALHGTDLVVHNVPLDGAAAEDVEALASGAASGAGISFRTVPDSREGGSSVDDFLTAAAQPDVELLVLWIRHRTQVGKLILGSTEQQILLDAPRPVLAVKA